MSGGLRLSQQYCHNAAHSNRHNAAHSYRHNAAHSDTNMCYDKGAAQGAAGVWLRGAQQLTTENISNHTHPLHPLR
jgi:hypothetical protein